MLKLIAHILKEKRKELRLPIILMSLEWRRAGARPSRSPLADKPWSSVKGTLPGVRAIL